MFNFSRVLFFAAAALLWSASANAVTVLNGSFESGPSGGSFVTLAGGDTSIAGWTVTGHSTDYIISYWQAADGTHSVDLNGNGVGGISQSIATTFGQQYLLTFYMSFNPDSFPGPKSLSVDTGSGATAFSYNTPHDKLDMKWELRSLLFTAAGSTTLLSFSSIANAEGNCCWGAAIDNVSVAAVPEASTWMMMILGFAGLGLVTYRRSRQSSAPSAA